MFEHVLPLLYAMVYFFFAGMVGRKHFLEHRDGEEFFPLALFWPIFIVGSIGWKVANVFVKVGWGTATFALGYLSRRRERCRELNSTLPAFFYTRNEEDKREFDRMLEEHTNQKEVTMRQFYVQADIEDQKITIEGDCVFTGKPHSVTVNKDQFMKWKDGALVQDAFPSLSTVDREFLISGIGPEGQKRVFK